MSNLKFKSRTTPAALEGFLGSDEFERAVFERIDGAWVLTGLNGEVL